MGWGVGGWVGGWDEVVGRMDDDDMLWLLSSPLVLRVGMHTM